MRKNISKLLRDLWSEENLKLWTSHPSWNGEPTRKCPHYQESDFGRVQKDGQYSKARVAAESIAVDFDAVRKIGLEARLLQVWRDQSGAPQVWWFDSQAWCFKVTYILNYKCQNYQLPRDMKFSLPSRRRGRRSTTSISSRNKSKFIHSIMTAIDVKQAEQQSNSRRMTLSTQNYTRS